jgi:Cdc6-like AAA superfamily ATPase
LEHSIFLEKINNLNFYLYPRFPKIDSENYKTILFIGETGSGKTSSINFFLNSYLGVDFKDNIRFKLIQEEI